MKLILSDYFIVLMIILNCKMVNLMIKIFPNEHVEIKINKPCLDFLYVNFSTVLALGIQIVYYSVFG